MSHVPIRTANFSLKSHVPIKISDSTLTSHVPIRIPDSTVTSHVPIRIPDSTLFMCICFCFYPHVCLKEESSASAVSHFIYARIHVPLETAGCTVCRVLHILPLYV